MSAAQGSVRRIVMPVRGDGKGENVFAHAAAVAKRHGARIVVTHCRARAEDMMPYGVPIPAAMKRLLLQQSRTVADQVEAGLRDEVVRLAAARGLSVGDATAAAADTDVIWVEEPGRQVDVIKRHGRLADLVCVAQPDVDRNLGANTLKAALFNTGRPVMMCPHADVPPETLCERVAIAWNGSVEASRAVAMTLGLVERATAVTVLTGGTGVDGAGADALVRYLAERGVTATVVRFDASRKVGRELLAKAADAGADTLIMGAYGQSHERETVFGGNTQHVVDRSKLPVILVH